MYLLWDDVGERADKAKVNALSLSLSPFLFLSSCTERRILILVTHTYRRDILRWKRPAETKRGKCHNAGPAAVNDRIE